MDNSIFNQLFNNDINFCHEPKLYNISDYNEAIDTFVNEIKNTNEVISVFQVGRINVPGISDIDLILILKDKINPANRNKFLIFNFPGKFIYLFLHEPLIFNINLIKDIYYWSPYPNLNKIYGENIKIDKLSSEERKMADIILLIECFISEYPRRILTMLLKKNIKIRQTLCYLNSIKYITEMIESITQQNMGYDEYFIEYEKFRANWFNAKNNKYNSLVSYIIKSIEICFKSVESLSDFISKNERFVKGYNTDKNIDAALKAYLDRQYLTVFTKNINIDKWLKTTINFYNKTGLILIIMPEVFFELIESYSSLDNGLISRHINKFKYNSEFQSTSKLFKDEICETAKRKIIFLNKHIIYLGKNGILNRLSNVNAFGYRIDNTLIQKILRPLKNNYNTIRKFNDLHRLKKLL